MQILSSHLQPLWWFQKCSFNSDDAFPIYMPEPGKNQPDAASSIGLILAWLWHDSGLTQAWIWHDPGLVLAHSGMILAWIWHILSWSWPGSGMILVWIWHILAWSWSGSGTFWHDPGLDLARDDISYHVGTMTFSPVHVSPVPLGDHICVSPRNLGKWDGWRLTHYLPALHHMGIPWD